MRHGKRFNHLSRTSAHRKAMLANMASSLIIHKRIKTTLPKAKALRTYIEPLITKSKTDSTHSRRVVFSYLNDKEAVTELFREISIKVAERPGGYTRIIKIGTRLGDNAEMAFIELVDYNENLLGADDKAQKKTRRRRGSAKKQEADAPAADQTVETVDETEEEKIEEEKIEEGKTEEPKTEEEKTEEQAPKTEEGKTEEGKTEEEKTEEQAPKTEEGKTEEEKIEEVKEEEPPKEEKDKKE